MAQHQVAALGIVGGLGPEAGCALHQYIIEDAHIHHGCNKDQDHLEVLHLSFPSIVTDRTQYLLSNQADVNPAEGVYGILTLLEAIGQKQDAQIVTGIPCNTFHAPPIYNELLKHLEQKPLEHIKLLNMIELTGQYLQHTFKAGSRIGLLSTTGARETQLFTKCLTPLGFQVIELEAEMQPQVQDAIYNSEWGLKSASPATAQAKSAFESNVNLLKEQGVDTIILGCTEIPLALPFDGFAGVPLTNPMKVLAHHMVEQVFAQPH